MQLTKYNHDLINALEEYLANGYGEPYVRRLINESALQFRALEERLLKLPTLNIDHNIAYFNIKEIKHLFETGPDREI